MLEIREAAGIKMLIDRHVIVEGLESELIYSGKNYAVLYVNPLAADPESIIQAALDKITK